LQQIFRIHKSAACRIRCGQVGSRQASFHATSMRAS
jgi:hypothetical protein